LRTPTPLATSPRDHASASRLNRDRGNMDKYEIEQAFAAAVANARGNAILAN